MLTYTAGANGFISGTSPQTVNYGSSGTTVKAVPANGYHFVNWSDGSTANPRADTNVTANISVTASFAINTYTLTYTAGANGSISGASPQTVNYGSSGTAVLAVPANGYHFVNWSDSSTANPRADTNVTANISVTASFAINTYTLTYTAGANGFISGASPQTVNYGSSGTAVLAVPANGYYFLNWSDSSTANPRTDTNVTANISVTATFSPIIYTLITSVNPAGAGAVSPSGGSYPIGTSVILTASPASGWVFGGWSGSNDLASTTANPTTITMKNNEIITATFIQTTQIIYTTLTTSVNPTGGGTVSPSGGSYRIGTSVTLTASPATGWVFGGWSGSNDLASTTANPTTITMNWNETVTATFTQTPQILYMLTTLVNPTGAGTVSFSGGSYPGASMTLTALPATGWVFGGWSGSNDLASTTANPTTITMNKNETVTATFIQTTQIIYYGPSNKVFGSGDNEAIPPNGVYAQTGQTLTLSWSADGNLTGYIFSANQYNNFQQSHYSVTSYQSGYGSQVSISYTVQNSGTYYAVLYDGASVLASTVEDYSVTLTVH